MRTASDCLAAAFGAAFRRVHLVVLDIVAKGVWVVGSGVVLWASGLWFLWNVRLTDSDLAAVESGFPPLVSLALFEAFVDNLPLLGWSIVAGATVCLLLWTAIEAFVRGGILPVTGNTLLGDAVEHFPLYVATGIIRRLILLLAAFSIGVIVLGPLLTSPVAEWSSVWRSVQWPVVAGAIPIVFMALFLAILDTLTRCRALELLGPSLPSILLIVLFPIVLEASIWSLGVAVFAIAITSAAAPGAVLALAGIFVAGMSVVHSYLLLVRYQAVGMMRRDS